MKLNKLHSSAVWDWLENKNNAESKYGHISNWDTSEVTDMKFYLKTLKILTMT